MHASYNLHKHTRNTEAFLPDEEKANNFDTQKDNIFNDNAIPSDLPLNSCSMTSMSWTQGIWFTKATRSEFVFSWPNSFNTKYPH